MWNVEYWHRNADGEVLQYKKNSNAIVENWLEHAMERLIAELDADASLAFTDPAAAEIGTANAVDQIMLMNTDDTTGVREGANILLLVDGTNNVDAAHFNPADGAYSNPGAITTDGDGEVSVTFLAQGNPVVTTQMQLVKAPLDDTTIGSPAVPDVAAVDVLAVIEITVDLADTDTLTVTWTIDVD